MSRDPVDRKLRLAMLALIAFCIIELSIGLWTLGVVLIFDAIHNAYDAGLLHLNRVAHRWTVSSQYNELSRRNCHLIPLMPMATALGLIAATVPVAAFAIVDLWHPHVHHPVVGLITAGASVVVNILVGRPLHAHHDNDHAHAASRHLDADVAASALAVGAFGVIWMWRQPIADPIATMIGMLVVGLLQVKVIKRSWNSFQKHREPQHSHEPASS